MKALPQLVLGIFGTLAFSWIGLGFIPNLQIGHLEPQTDEEGNDPYPAPVSGMAVRGERVYVANGCFYCHTQQVRADYAGADIERKWGTRRSAPRDYIFERPVELGQLRLGPDLSNVGKRAPAEDANAPPNASPAAGNPQSANPAAPPAANAFSAASAGSAVAANAVPSPVQGASSPSSQAPPITASSPGPTGGTPAAPIAENQPSPPPSPNPAPATAGAATNPANAAIAQASPGLQQAIAAVAGAATSAEGSRSESPPPYSAPWHHRHLYSPRSLNQDSNMPSYKFLYEKRPVGGQRAADALFLRGKEAPGDGWEVVPSYEAKCLVAYLMSLDQSHGLKEVKSVTPPAPPAPGKAAK